MGKSTKTKSTHDTEPHRASSAPYPQLGKGLAESAWRVALAFLLPSLAGIGLDSLFETEPIFTVAGIFLAFGITYKVVKDFLAKNYPTNQEDDS